MNLPAHPDGGVQIGISDILAWRDCAARAKFGRRRLTGKEAPESWSPQNAYGSAIHHCIQRLDEGATPDEAAGEAFALFKQWLEPSDLSRLHEDMAKYLAREMLGVRTLLNEGEISFKLFMHPVLGQVWLRCRIDRLYQSLEDPTQLVHVDYKSSKWAKSEEEVGKDLQIWSYNSAIHHYIEDLYPELENVSLQQYYDQLNFGMVPTRKGPEQRQEIDRWLIAAIEAMIDDEDELPTFNEWCPWCPLKMDCPVVQFELTEWAKTRIAALMPREPKKKKDGSDSKVLAAPKLDPARLAEYVELLPDVHRAAQVLTAFDDTLKKTLKELPLSDLYALGKTKSERTKRVFTVEAKREIIERVGLGTALMLFDISIAGIERFYGSKEEAAELIALAERGPGYSVVEDL